MFAHWEGDAPPEPQGGAAQEPHPRHDPHLRATRRSQRSGCSRTLRQYFPKGTDLSVHDEAFLDAVADELNDRPRKRLGFAKPIEQIADLLAAG